MGKKKIGSVSYKHLKQLWINPGTTGPAKDCIRGFPFTENSYPLVLKTLQDRFGSENDQASFCLGAMDNLSKINRDFGSSTMT